MTSADHINEAELILARAKETGHEWDEADLVAAALSAIGHALIAMAIENGVPHAIQATTAADHE